jgi:cytochrome c oxidase subunit 2
MWIKGTKEGMYRGQCAEFCGLDHAIMRFTIVVESQADFDAWLLGLHCQQAPMDDPLCPQATQSPQGG